MVLGITWEKIADTLEEFVSLGNLAQEIRSKYNLVNQTVTEGIITQMVHVHAIYYYTWYVFTGKPSSCTAAANKEYISDGLVLYKDKPIGSGAFGAVFRGELNGQPCAIKLHYALANEIQTQLPTASLASTDSTEKFRKECELFEVFQHPNIARHHTHTPRPHT